jgi:PPOX class probable F420-dependent enzyme
MAAKAHEIAHIPDSHRDLLARDKKAFAFLAVVLADGSPQVTPVWFDWDGTHIVVNTARGRVKDRAMRARPRVALTIPDPHDPYRYLMIRGRVVHETEEGAEDQIRRLNEKYHGRYEFDIPHGQVRVTYKILPERVTASR